MYQQQVTQVMFYIMPEPSSDDALAHNKADDYWLQACLQAGYYYQQKQRVFMFTDGQDDAHKLDELLWSFTPDSFVPHNLTGEGPKQGAPVEIGFQQPANRRPILINLASQVPSFASQYQQIIDFVPSNEALKQLARDRFRGYKQMGFNVQTQPAQHNSQNDSQQTSASTQPVKNN